MDRDTLEFLTTTKNKKKSVLREMHISKTVGPELGINRGGYTEF